MAAKESWREKAGIAGKTWDCELIIGIYGVVKAVNRSGS